MPVHPTPRPDGIHLGITPTCWTNDDFPLIGDDIPMEQCLSEIALAGFEGCSIGHTFPTDPDALTAAMHLRGLSVSEPWVSTYFTVPDGSARTARELLRVLEFLNRFNADGPPVRTTTIGVAEFGHSVHLQQLSLRSNKPEFTDEQWADLCEGLNKLGEIIAGQGFTLAYHPHMGTGVQTERDVDRLMRDTDPRHVGLLIDTGHLTWAGADLTALMERHRDRIAHVHLKNVRGGVRADRTLADGSFREYIEAGIFTVPGDSDGDIDFDTVLKVLGPGEAYRGWLVVEAEQDPRGGHPPLYYAQTAHAYLARALDPN
ncbi:myo-inosose-2 dehydratase [Streptomyces cinnabarinus]|uniref:Myo-inosose-2 dehydratase n=1 Tax=Streptomyces cinnabarinus TaxID=67287 RepID=A0ABY7KMH9_9ACTN|nr:myo-inosose-2 dehydratase [Streptomyces cinnabarinus]WAZ25769.1 myo-inosose-2 dehydratase [Streptomyces cinnabarinus]